MCGEEIDVGTVIQNTLICVEMFFFSVGHIYAFEVDDFADSQYTPIIQLLCKKGKV